MPAEPDHAAGEGDGDIESSPEASPVAAWFGPSVAIPEVFGYLARPSCWPAGRRTSVDPHSGPGRPHSVRASAR
jgi:hypothetical protein